MKMRRMKVADQPDRHNAPHNESKREYGQRQRRELGWGPAHQVQGLVGGAPPMCQEGEMTVQLNKWSGKAPPGETKGRDGANERSSQTPHDGCCSKRRGHPSKFPTGESETEPWGTGGRGARMYTAIKEVPRASPSEDEDGVSRRSRPAVRM